MRTIAIIPWRDDKERRSNLKWIRAYLENLCDEVIVSEDEGESPFSRAKAFNLGIEQIALTDKTVVVLCDSDCFVTRYAFKKAVRLAGDSGKFVLPYDCLCKTTKEQKEEVINSLDPAVGPRGSMFRKNRQFRKPSGGIGMVRADLLKEARFDERFVGWGSEDTAFFYLMKMKYGFLRLEGPLFHLDHPVADKSNFQKNKSLVQDHYVNVEIPKILNFVWVGDEMPDAQKANIESWKRHHPGWKIRIWGNDDLPWFLCQEAIQIQTNYAGMSDIMRVELIYREGGVYLDTDMECLRPIDAITKGTTSFVVRHDDKYICNGVFGAVAGHKVFKPVFDCFREMDFPQVGQQNHKTGPPVFTRLANITDDTLILDSKSFLPIPFEKRNELSLSDIDLSDAGIFAHHQWAHSWKNQTI